MAEEEGSATEAVALRQKFQDLISELKRSSESTLDASNSFCQDFCQVLMQHGCQWRPDEDPLPLLEMYTVAIMCCAEASPFLSPECEHVTDVLDKLSWSCLNLLLSFSEKIPGALWEEFQSSVKMAHDILQAHGNAQLHTLLTLVEENGVWSNATLCSLLSSDTVNVEKVHEFLSREGPELLHMRIKHLIKQKRMDKAAILAKICAEFPEFGGKKNFKQIYLVCLCEIKPQQELMQEIKEIDCKEALDMICNLESEEDEKGALSLCTAFFKRQLLSGDAYCAWELTLFWSKLLIRLESKQAFLEQCRLLARLSVSVYHILLLIKVIQAEVEKNGLSVCIEMCIQALKMGVDDNEGCNISICKTISCLLPLDLEVKRACQLTEFLINPSLDSYYAVETLFNEPDQKLEQEDPPILNSLRCDVLLALKTKWPFDPEFWDWKTLKRQCLALMGQEATAILSTDKCTDSEDNEVHDHDEKYFQHLHFIDSPNYELSEVEAERKKKREMKKMREMGFVSARFRNWQAYMQYCVLCDKEFLGHRIVKHALKHVQDGIFRCPICTKTFETRVVLEPHVASHVKQSCKERLAAMGVSKKRPSLDTKLAAASSTLKKEEHYIKTEKVSQGTISNNSVYASNGSPSTNVKSKIKVSSPKQGNPIRDVTNTEQCSCPVTSCQKVFKYFRNLVAHVKAHKNEQEATQFLEIQSQKAMCQYCHRQFVNVTHLNDHLQMHCGEKPYFCIQLGCNCSFSSHAELQIHRKVHAEFQAQCAYPNCERIFNETYLLYDHEAQHYVTFSCKSHNCDKVFYTLSELDLHQKGHAKQKDHSSVEGGSPSQLEVLTPTIPALELPPSQIKEVSQEVTPVESKCTVESIADNTQDPTEKPEPPVSCTAQLTLNENDSQTNLVQPDESETPLCPESTKQSHLESCYVKLEPIPIKSNDPMYLDAVKNADSETQTLLKDKKLFSFPWSQLKPSTLKSPPSVTKANREEGLNHVCPFETCTRKYSTSKSLSRHVKNVHSEAFEEWKLSKKYKRIAEIAAKKSSSGHTTTSSRIVKWTNRSKQTEHTTLLDSVIESPSSVFSSHDSMQPISAKFCSQLENTQSATSNQTDLMQLPINQTWATPSMENLDSGFSVHPYRSTILSENQHTTPSYHSDTVLDYATASSYDDIVPLSANPHTPSSVMNEASKYVSSSLRVLHALNSEQTCDLSQVESSVNLGFSRIGQNHLTDISVSTLSGQNGSLYFPTMPSEAGPVSVQSLENSNKEISTDGTDALLSSDVKHMLNPLTPHFKESSEDFFSAAPLTGEKSPEDFCNHELSQEGTEGITSDDQNVSGSGETRKSKKIKTSKRTKWPAIIQDGKVICCRCYREFSSTKSLGGHLSKRSQCKTVDEIDLTGDLPVSFLDFLNDPDISMAQMPLPMNDVLEDAHKSCVYAPSESNTFNSNTLTSMHGGTDSIQNTNMSSQDPSEMTRNYSFFHPPVSNTGKDIKPEAVIISANTGEDGKIMEIERALQRLDLVDILSRDKSEIKSQSTNLHDQSSKAVISNDQCHTIEDPEQNEQKCVLKPFRCEEGCVYGAMTKEALFKHLSRVHDYSEDRINQMKKNPDKFAPYSCHLCSKTFTRTTGLKIHYKNVHHFSKEEVSLLKIGLGFRKIRKSTSKSENVHASLINDQGNDSLSKQFQHQINPNLPVTSVDSNVKGEGNIVTKKKKKRPTQKSFTVSSTQTSKTVEASQKNLKLEVLPATCVKPPKDPSLTAENHVSELNEPGTFAMQELSSQNLFLLDTMNAPDERTQNATTQTNRPIEMNSNVMVDIQEKTTMPVDTFDSGDTSDTHIMFRPYRCVHEGCVAAFSIQQNLILHYRAMHQSERDEKNSAKESDGVVQVQEYRCQVKQCSKVVSKVTSLLKHYLLLHRCTLEKASALLSGVEVGTFQCDQSKCSAHFTCHLKYIDHIKNDHKAIKVSADGDFESVDLTFGCQFEGCDRVYTTKSNLLRHLIKKHDATFETMKEKQKNAIGNDIQAKKLSASSNNGKENIANNNIKTKKKHSKKKEDKVQNLRVALEKPALKSIDEASAMCNQRLPLQYPCMIESCDSVMSDEQSILKHYTTHGLADQYIEDQRSQFIFCMKSSEMPREDSTSKNIEVEETVKVPDEDQTDHSNVSPEDVSPEPAAEVPVNPVNESFTAPTMPVVKRKRGRPRKSECRNKVCVERKQSLRNCSGEQVKCMLKVSGSILNSSNSQGNQVEKDVALKLYKPSEFETSVLKFSKDTLSNPSKRQRKLKPIIQERDQVQCVVNFRNPLKIETVKNVKIVMYENLSTCSELLLKQLQDMQPLVILEKELHS
ncbi:zinc finger protein 292a isoform X2 [Ctenopharyngodon idella]|uniref:zinc finger protein 292a isoform X2 n=1 Tax=Ctenopharyngodon idella TaxID=7959 RepID=UPI00222FC6B1|nr:zinc finger protein 292a isoform X2 [Ctenopharyngodon idella]